MRTSFAMAAVLTAFVLWTAPAMAADTQRPVVTAEKDVPTGPRICLFSQNGKRAEPAPAPEAEKIEPAQSEAVSASTEPAPQQAAMPAAIEVAQGDVETNEIAPTHSQTPPAPNRHCDTDAAAPAPHG